MGQYGYTLPNGAVIVVTAPNQEEGTRKLKIEHDRLLNPTLGQRGRGVVGLINQGITSGWSDEIGAGGAAAQGWEEGDPVGASYRDSLNSQRNDIAERRAAHPYISQGIETAAAMLPAMATMGGSVAVPTLGRMAATGSLWGGASAAGHNEAADPDNVPKMVLDLAGDTTKGALAGAVTNVAMGRALNGPQLRGPSDPVAASQQMVRGAQRTYRELLEEDAPVPGFAAHGQAIFDRARRQGVGEIGDPALWQRIENVQRVIDTAAREGREVSYFDVDQLLKNVRGVADSTKNTSQRALAIQMMNDLTDALPEGVREARFAADAAYRRGMRSDAVSTATNTAGLNASSSGSGGNTINTQRQAIKGLLLKEQHAKYFTDAEIEMMTDFVRGGDVENLLRRLGAMSPTRSAVVPIILGTMGINNLASGTAGSSAATMGTVGMAGAGYLGQKSAEGLQNLSMRELQRLILTGEPQLQTVPWAVNMPKAVATRAGAAAGATDTQSYYQSLLDLIGQGDEKDGR